MLIANDEVEEMLRGYGRHLVGLTCLAQPIDPNGEPNGLASPRFYSGFVIQIRRSWWWATAGHVVDALEKEQRSSEVRLSGFMLIDRYGTGVHRTDRLPFDYEGARKIYHYDKGRGIDYGVVALRPHDVRLLKANRLVAVPKKEWGQQDKLAYEGYFMMGLPADSYERSMFRTKTGYRVHGNAVPSAM